MRLSQCSAQCGYQPQPISGLKALAFSEDTRVSYRLHRVYLWICATLFCHGVFFDYLMIHSWRVALRCAALWHRREFGTRGQQQHAVRALLRRYVSWFDVDFFIPVSTSVFPAKESKAGAPRPDWRLGLQRARIPVSKLWRQKYVPFEVPGEPIPDLLLCLAHIF